ncbi:hypothetical protein ABTM57_20250, partial [Acinetobacter baumannii]
MQVPPRHAACAFCWKEGTGKIYTYPMESDTPLPAKRWPEADPAVDALANDVIGQVADKWTMLILEVLAEHGELRFT